MATVESTFGGAPALQGLALRVLQDAPVVILVLDLQGRIQVVLRVDPGVPQVLCDPNQLHQVVGEAMPMPGAMVRSCPCNLCDPRPLPGRRER